MTPPTTGLQTALADRYTSALRAFLEDPDEAALANAYEIGRGAFGDGFGVLEMAAVHARALSAVLDEPLDAAERARRLDAVDRFFGEVLSPFEMAHRGFREANAVLHDARENLTEQARGDLAVRIAAAKIRAADVALEIGTRVFELTGARATSNTVGLDIFWRNVRTHTLHDPVAYKRREVGGHLLTGELPEPTWYT